MQTESLLALVQLHQVSLALGDFLSTLWSMIRQRSILVMHAALDGYLRSHVISGSQLLGAVLG